MAFPLGIRQARYAHGGAPTAWYWGINGAFSVISSVLALVVAVFWGVTMTLVVGLTAYVVALVALRLHRSAAYCGCSNEIQKANHLPRVTPCCLTYVHTL